MTLLLLPTPLDVASAFIRKCVIRLTDALPLTDYNDSKLRMLLKSSESQQFFAYHFRACSRKLITSKARSDTLAYVQLASFISFVLDETKRQSTFSVAAAILESTIDTDTDRSNGPEYAMYCLNHLVREHSVWSDDRLWMDAFYQLKTLEARSAESKTRLAQMSRDPLALAADFEDPSIPLIIHSRDLPYNEENKEKFWNTLVAERLVYAMTMLEVSPDVIRAFIKYVVAMEILEKPYQDFLEQYLKVVRVKSQEEGDGKDGKGETDQIDFKKGFE
ncbi:uncharacterized protein MONOS_695 [Monocercomonoides exilis]|uniref:uncharacterized protein n=1 Tax=Monocercomonoides exilis TaxID=2049356 RepID=UPI003559F4AE|nr:hypothetical protein MONOS_695 [Monocercomonoides exilis]|eukprot:MONOS_695.1-p1 / transcript=MONOS_695.1 / gene=MONOS_695 / organism=Monocercomonoides_exilis_PA203 / gene_product=unspecified product / transcript_product=unspecified product / location=Mono_scaffold00011:216879-217827(+) / protein_length=276 / sequence_SO=supercontig / SO=protein_coding / is_pseudo=false